MKPVTMTRIVAQRRYSTATATLLASDAWWDGHNWERSGRQTWLYRTAAGSYFTVTVSQWSGERDVLEPCSIEDAQLLYEGSLSEHEVEYSEAFPDVVVADA